MASCKSEYQVDLRRLEPAPLRGQRSRSRYSVNNTVIIASRRITNKENSTVARTNHHHHHNHHHHLISLNLARFNYAEMEYVQEAITGRAKSGTLQPQLEINILKSYKKNTRFERETLLKY